MMEKYGVDDVKKLQEDELKKVQQELVALVPSDPSGDMSKEASTKIKVLQQRERQLKAAIGK